MLIAQISLTLFLSIRPYHPSLLVGLPNYILCPHRAVVDKFLLNGQHWYIHVKGSIGECHLWVCPCFSSSVPAYLVYIIWMVLEMGSKLPYNYCFVGFYFKKLFDIACRSCLVFSLYIKSASIWCIYCSINTTTTWKKASIFLSDRSDFHMIDSILITVQAFVWCKLISLSVDEMLLPRLETI